MTKQKADAIYNELCRMAPQTGTEQQLRDALETLRKAGELLRMARNELSCFGYHYSPTEAWLAEWEGK